MLRISKYHGCGNDFIIAEERDLDGLDLARLIPQICDRHSGIGADGFILARRAPLEMVYYNQDGSRAPMCGNGLRCFARFCYDERIALRSRYTVATLAGPMEVALLGTAPFEVELSMGRADHRPEALGISCNGYSAGGGPRAHGRTGAPLQATLPASLPKSLPGQNPATYDAEDSPLWGHSLEAEGVSHLLYSFFMATDHSVYFCRDSEDPEDPALQARARALSAHPFFPRQINLNLVRVIDSSTIALRTWERGAGLTLACGTGACAAALAAYKTHRCDNHITVLLPKGRLAVSISEDEEVFLRGPAEPIMKGVYYDY